MHFFNVRALAMALALSTFSFPVSSLGQRPPAQPNAAEILHKMQKLNVLGSVLGTHMALKHGTGFVRGIFIAVVSLLILKTGYDAFLR